MITPGQCVTDLYTYITECVKSQKANNGDIKVYKFDDKPASYKGKYIAINCLPFTYDQVVSKINAVNINLHAPKLKNGGADRITMDGILHFISAIIPEENSCEDSAELFLNGVYYCIHTVSQPLEDTDGTYFYNIRLSITFK